MPKPYQVSYGNIIKKKPLLFFRSGETSYKKSLSFVCVDPVKSSRELLRDKVSKHPVNSTIQPYPSESTEIAE